VSEFVQPFMPLYDDGLSRTAAAAARGVLDEARAREPPRIDHAPRASYSAVRKPRGGSGTVSASARRALPLKRRSG